MFGAQHPAPGQAQNMITGGYAEMTSEIFEFIEEKSRGPEIGFDTLTLVARS
jgi:hypothetical protein